MCGSLLFNWIAWNASHFYGPQAEASMMPFVYAIDTK